MLICLSNLVVRNKHGFLLQMVLHCTLCPSLYWSTILTHQQKNRVVAAHRLRSGMEVRDLKIMKVDLSSAGGK